MNDCMVWKYRREQGLTAQELARLTGITPVWLCKIEKGWKKPGRKFKEACSRVLGVAPELLFPARRGRKKIDVRIELYKEKKYKRPKTVIIGYKQGRRGFAELLRLSFDDIDKLIKKLQGVKNEVGV